MTSNIIYKKFDRILCEYQIATRIYIYIFLKELIKMQQIKQNVNSRKINNKGGIGYFSIFQHFLNFH